MVSVIVPVYNVEKYIKQCLDSLIAQTIEDIEIILIDDGSTDLSSEICDYYASMYKNVKVIHNKNVGLGLSRNVGLSMAKGEYVGFVDSDDYINPKMYERLMNLAKNTNADIAYCSIAKFTGLDAGENSISIDETWRVWKENEIKKYLLNRIGSEPYCKNDNYYGASVCAAIFKKSLIEENHIRFLSERQYISEDVLFNIDLISICKTIVHCNDKLYYYRYNPNSLTTKYKADRFKKGIEVYQETCRRLAASYNETEYFNCTTRYLISIARIAILQEAKYIGENGMVQSYKNIKSICENEDLNFALKRYNYKIMPKKYFVVCSCIVQKRVGILLLASLLNCMYKRMKCV